MAGSKICDGREQGARILIEYELSEFGLFCWLHWG